MAGAVDSLRADLRAALGADGLPVGLEAALAGLPWQAAGRAVDGLAHTAFSIVWHLGAWTRAEIAVVETVGGSRLAWTGPEDPSRPSLWPARVTPLAESEWRIAVEDALGHLDTVRGWIDRYDLLAPLPGDDGRTLAGEIALIAAHTAYHVAQIVDHRSLIGHPVDR